MPQDCVPLHRGQSTKSASLRRDEYLWDLQHAVHLATCMGSGDSLVPTGAFLQGAWASSGAFLFSDQPPPVVPYLHLPLGPAVHPIAAPLIQGIFGELEMDGAVQRIREFHPTPQFPSGTS